MFISKMINYLLGKYTTFQSQVEKLKELERRIERLEKPADSKKASKFVC